jgi:hypothetical protein
VIVLFFIIGRITRNDLCRNDKPLNVTIFVAGGVQPQSGLHSARLKSKHCTTNRFLSL